MEELHSHLRTRLVGLGEAKDAGIKIIGYTPGGYFPEELVLACGAIPVGLIRGGEHSPVERSGEYICRWIDTFCRAQIGYAISGEDPYYGIIDLLVVPMTDNHIRAISDVLDFNTDIEIFPYGVPHKKERATFDYFLQGINRVKGKLEKLTGREITKANLSEAIHLCNRERELLKQISLMRKHEMVPISSRDFIALNHGSFYADKKFMIEVLETLCRELKEKDVAPKKGPRILLTGSTIALGDNRISDSIEEAGGVVVVEEFAEGMRPYWENVGMDGDLMENIASCYFLRRIAPAWFRPNSERLEFLIHLAKDFRAAGVVWYQLMYRESYKLESFYFSEILKKQAGLSMLTVESDYEGSETGTLGSRVEPFIESMRGI
jgi:benzoyl-CoA reductase/2-hydroxyglutaryl-CoA dehydratase subunit BcrC/BadD/HgdB